MPSAHRTSQPSPRTSASDPPFLHRWGRLTAARSRLVIGIGVLLTLVGLVLAAGAMDRLVLSRFETPGSESVTTRAVLEKKFVTGTPSRP
ncbi:hypothetical protein ABZ763_30525 [Streptomyces bacillaris]|uniref:hypothetical protein n=1 Tax=Streptomyces bacillaris TaxID=68179 RepID=UPI00345FE976